MEIREPTESEKNVFDKAVPHPVQSFAWGEFRKKMGVRLIRRIVINQKKVVGAFELTIHKIPHTPYTVGYMPKCILPDEAVIEELMEIGKANRCIFIKLEPHVERNSVRQLDGQNLEFRLVQSSHPSFAQFTFQIDLTKSEEELLKKMHPKTRYNIRVAQKHGVTVEEDNSLKAFNTYLDLTEATTKRQRFYAHNRKYHQEMWKAMRKDGVAHLLIAKYKKKVLVCWVLLIFNGVLYYPYGASSGEYKEVMTSNLMMWEAIKFGEKMGCKVFDMWGSLGPNPNPRDPWYGFHRFKEGYGGELVEFVGSYDLVLSPFLYKLYNRAHRARWLYLRVIKSYL